MIELVWTIAAAIGALMLLPIAVAIVGVLLGIAVLAFCAGVVWMAEKLGLDK